MYEAIVSVASQVFGSSDESKKPLSQQTAKETAKTSYEAINMIQGIFSGR